MTRHAQHKPHITISRGLSILKIYVNIGMLLKLPPQELCYLLDNLGAPLQAAAKQANVSSGLNKVLRSYLLVFPDTGMLR